MLAGVDFSLDDAEYRAWLEEVAKVRTVVLFDWRGLGVSGPNPRERTFDAFLDDLRAVVDAVAPADAVDLWSRVSLSHVAVRFAADHPERVRSMFLVNPVPAGGGARGVPRIAMIWPIARQDWEYFSELYAFAQYGWMRADAGQKAARRVAQRLSPDMLDELMDAVAALDAFDLAPRVQCPTAIYVTERAQQLPTVHQIRAWAATLPQSQLVHERASEESESIPIHVPLRMTLLSRQLLTTFIDFLGNEERAAASDASFMSATGFRTILFTDVVSSTPLLTQLRDARMREVMRDHDAVMEAAVTGHGGRVVKTIGDAFMAEFGVPSAAVEAAIEAQRNIREEFADSDVPVRIRIGINAGEPIEENGDLHGASVVIAKRLESAADTNGILVSDIVKQMVTGKDFDFEDRGPVELKGFDEPVRAWAVRWE
jgi:class 3 adenylate cyclase/pimeloyl-ACP methyl ester carboxylesterase